MERGEKLLLYLLLGLSAGAGLWLSVRGSLRRGRVWCHPSWRERLHAANLNQFADFLALPEVVVSGHSGRRVSRVEVAGQTMYLKREERVGWGTRFRNWWAGYGWSSLARREAKLLAQLERAALPGPDWVAYGEDTAGRAFLLVAAAPGVALPEYLAQACPKEKRRVACALGQVLAQLHAAGFAHHDLYAKHIFISDTRITLLDWQRGGRRLRQPLRDLITLHATLDDTLCPVRDRLAFLRSYGKGPPARLLHTQAARLLAKRHIREKRGLVQGHTWTLLEGRALCVTPALGPVPPWLNLDATRLLPGQTRARRWLTLDDGRRVLLVRQRGRTSAMQYAHLLWRLERHGIRGPRVLAAGERGRDSFVLLEPAQAIRLTAWLGKHSSSQRMQIWRQTDQLLVRLAEAGRGVRSLDALAVTPEGEVVIGQVEAVVPRRAVLPVWTQEWQEAGGVIPTFWKRRRRGIERPDWPDFAGSDWPERIMSVEVTDRFAAKQGRSTGRWILSSADGRRLVVYLKRHYRLGWLSAILARVWPSGDWSPAMQEANHLEWARLQGVPVPAVVAAGEFIGPGGVFQSYLAVEELTGQLPLHEAIPLAEKQLAAEDFIRWKRSLVQEMARLSRVLHDRNHFHKDLYLCHFYIHEEDTCVVRTDWRGRVSLIDLHRLSHHPWLPILYQSKDLAQLLYSSEIPGICFRDRVAFWRAYRGEHTSSRSQRLLLRVLRFRWGRYRRHNLRHQKGGAA
jgi:heptose I phosphotransferase